MNIFEKLQECRCELQKAKLKKSGKNKFAGFEYFELKDFLPTVNEMFNKHKLCSNFSINGLASLKIVDMEKPEDVIEFTSPVAELELKGCNSIQALGGVHTYLKRYLYLNALEIVEADMFDSTSGKKEPELTEEEKEHIDNIKACTSRNDLELYWASLPNKDQKNKDILKVFKEMGEKYPKQEVK